MIIINRRFRGLGIVPLATGIPNTSRLSTPKSLPWDEQRIFVVDSNQQLLYAVSHAGHPIQVLTGINTSGYKYDFELVMSRVLLVNSKVNLSHEL